MLYSTVESKPWRWREEQYFCCFWLFTWMYVSLFYVVPEVRNSIFVADMFLQYSNLRSLNILVKKNCLYVLAIIDEHYTCINKITLCLFKYSIINVFFLNHWLIINLRPVRVFAYILNTDLMLAIFILFVYFSSIYHNWAAIGRIEWFIDWLNTIAFHQYKYHGLNKNGYVL